MSRWKIADVMTADVASVREDAGFKELVDLLVDRNVSAVPVVDGADHVVGLVSEADLLHKVEFAGTSLAGELFERRRHRVAREKASGDDARELMTSPAVTATADMKVVEAARLMESKQVKQVPVVDREGRLVGIVSRRDLLKSFLQPDPAIRDEVVDQVLRRALGLEPAEVTVEVCDGVVTVTGTLDRRSLIPIAVRLIRGVDGVVEVIDRLTYRHDDTAEVRTSRYMSPP